ncbi:Uma2 family endonuclease [Nodularia harveyana UHCC-0300]|uniref:Uma2 family endonuclease n=1 Tax=Nodularia harveyana UHCC-0300 TaxID=2974287 RepID=A0ABU5UIC1_9CYAN|nr:Uma2 family endonuclease [Nodularia harveyana]MEA5583250.1 Uma2 family endonuclease [Nodularia harveyana UHCC-0300]
MVQALTKPLTFEEFLIQYGNNPRYELADGELIDMEPTGPHETVGGKLATQLGIAITTAQLPWFIPRTCLIRPFAEIATARRPDIVVLDETVLNHEPFWQNEPVITLGQSIKLVVEVVSTNWETDYARKVEEYALLGIPEYWIVDYRGLGGVIFIGKPKQPTFTVCQLIDEDYSQQKYRLGQFIKSPLLPSLQLRLDDVRPR